MLHDVYAGRLPQRELGRMGAAPVTARDEWGTVPWIVRSAASTSLPSAIRAGSAGRLRPAQIHGYTHEEYTHAAVAAMVASGAADAGFGIEAAAVQQEPVFVPLAAERYFLAARAAAWTQPGPQAVLAALKGRLLRTALRGLAGYDATATAEPQDIRAALAREKPCAPPVNSPG